MQKRSIEEYIREMERMYARAMPAVIKTGHERPGKLTKQKEPPEKDETAAAIAVEPLKDEDIEIAVQQTDGPQDADTAEKSDEAISESEKEYHQDGMGRLIVTVTTGAGLFPVENATVIVSKDAGPGGDEIAAVKSDKSGRTPILYLPAPDKNMSQHPQEDGIKEETRAQYTVTVSAPGYVTVVVESISVFDGVTAIQKIDMLTVSAANGSSAPRIINEKTIYQL